MKKLLLSILLFLPMFALQSCDEKEIPKVPAAIAFPDSATPAPTFLTDGGAETITFSSTQAWTAGVEAGKTWCTVTPANGEAGAAASMTISVAKNATYDSRSAVVTIVSEGVEQPITVTQSQNDSFSFTGAPKDALPATESKFVITTAENTGAPKVGTLPEWITVATAPAAKGLTNTTLTFTVKANTTFDNREAKITITSGGKDESFVVKQSQVDSFAISGQPTETFGINGGTFTITTAENTGAPTVGELPEWITVATAPAAKGLSNTKLTFTVKENKTTDEHSAEITVTSGAKSDKFTVTQLNLNSPITIPDANFKACLLGKFDTNGDNEISYSEAAKATEIGCSNRSISSLTGIEHFTALKKLTCYNNQLTALDVTKNIELTYLDCYKNQLTALDLSKNTQLTFLFCYNNQITDLDLSKNTQLTYLYCAGNQLSALDVKNNTLLTNLNCQQNQLTALDVSKHALLTFLDCKENQLTALDISNNPALTDLKCDPMNDDEGTNLLTSVFLTQAQKEANDAKKFIYSPTETALTVR